MAASTTRLARALAVAALLALPNAFALAQTEEYAPIVLQLPASARATGVGGAFVGVRDIESIFSNVALSGVSTGTAFSVERFRASSGGSIASSMSLGAFGVSIAGQYLTHSAPVSCNYVSCDNGFPPVGSGVLSNTVGPAGASSLAGSVALSTAFHGLRWGAALKYVREQLGGFGDGTAAGDFGVAKDGGSYTTGLTVQNIGSDIVLGHKVQLPLRATLGVAGFSRPVGPLDVAGSFAVSVLRDGFVSPAGGLEWSYSPLEGYNYVVRLGARRPELREQRPLTAGASFTLDRFTIDYAFEDLRGGAAHRVGLRIR